MSRSVTSTTPEILPPLSVEALVNGGAGLVRHEGQVVFVPHTAVGDVITCAISKRKKTYAEARLVDLVEPGPGRCQPICPVAGECGGCQWQHLAYPEQAFWKDYLFRQTLIRRCSISEERILPLLVAPEPFAYRSRVQIKCHNTGAGFITGFYRPQSRYVVGVEHCPLIPDKLNGLLGELRIRINGSFFAGEIPQIDLAIDDHDKCTAVVHYLGHHSSDLADRLGALQGLADIFLQQGTKKKIQTVCGDGRLGILVDEPPLELKYLVGGFAQINLAQNRVMVAKVLDLLNWSKNDRVVDLYCGMGNFSLPLARRVDRVLGVEESPLSIAMAKQNAVDNGLLNAHFQCHSAEQDLSGLLASFPVDILILDPPRSGAYEVMKQIAEKMVSHVIYISCDPQTFARDLCRLIHCGYEVVSSQPLDMFPQTYHCESITYLRRRP
ncbi:class I SAM-dependent RNA methyltransferase [Pelobacter seleniigenes]|uniref:class I SAM-dependent RNA methyltransferase n=1 Tax=Pelobacter seleniigenes TaxID=407188 RepID=UPI000A792860|nr:class I SAM-dependent RNA methyltransferase [Pelobacter seleniigenes]